MRRFRRCARMLILFLFLFSVCLPIMLFFGAIKHIQSDVSEEYLEDLTTIKHRIDALKVSSGEQDGGKALKEPTHVVYAQILEANNNHTHSYGSEDARFRNQSSPEKILSEKAANGSIQTGQLKETIVRHDKIQRSSQSVLDKKVKEIRDQILSAKVYLSFAPKNSNSHFVKELKTRIKELERAVGDKTKDSDLSKSALQKMRGMEATLLKASRLYPHCSDMIKRLRALTANAEEQVRAQTNHAAFLVRLAGRTTPKSLHCLSMRLTSEYFSLQPEERGLIYQHQLHNQQLYHLAVFSDNVLACAVVVNSTISTATEPEKMVFHIVTDALNLPSITMWFLRNPPGKAAIQIQSIENFESLFPKFDAAMPKRESPDPRYTFALNYLRFYLPDIFPYLNKIVLLDHDVVVQKDLKGLWSVDMKGKVNGAVAKCEEVELSPCRMDLLINFSDPFVTERFNNNAFTWAFGMNLFDLKEWRKRDLTDVYHKYQQLGSRRPLWKAGSLPLGWVTFYNQTVVLNKRWHVHGLGHDSGIPRGDIERAAVIHYDGTMKPWLDVALDKYKYYWKKYIKHDQPYLQDCNI